MSSAITNAGEALIALHQNQETALVIDTFIVANVTGVDPAGPVDRAEGLPDPGDIVYQYTIPAENKGYINPNQVVYSMLLESDIGDFEFNWLGLYSSADDTVVAITYCPSLSKWKTAHPAMGNAITRNFMLEYTGLQATTQITVEASTWQIDFTARLKGIDERERLSNRDLYGRACFFDSGFLVVNDAGAFKVQPGTGYVEGIRIDQGAVQAISPGALPATVYLDVALQAQGSDRVAVAAVAFADPGDYTDATNDTHYGQPIAAIDAGGVVTDLRPTRAMGTGILAGVAGVDHTHDGYALEGHTHPTIETDYIDASALLPTEDGGAASGVIATATHGQRYGYRALPGDTDACVEITYPIPEAWERGPIKLRAVWTPGEGAAAGEDMTLVAQAVAVGDGESMDAAYAVAGVTIADQAQAVGAAHVSPASAGLTVEGEPALGDLIHLRIMRDVDAGATPMAADCQLMGIWIQYTCNQAVTGW
ncbi:phage tail protein [Pseudodesulfovibrio aespoeensis]|uniref:phage tail protein n=1 Tax=Pseudodesulfovibrio aespoeensis TaxID=182210 RepID=UPI0023570439|nr:phage tail protein [Pseudodesulfovibrio aespoeensis]MCG2732084.1 phage tail protein [Pseudodesulfovibrio aespoeensis]